jgi:hypothetical protein
MVNQALVTYQYTSMVSSGKQIDLGDNCTVFENFTASIGDLMIANLVNGYSRSLNRQLIS